MLNRIDLGQTACGQELHSSKPAHHHTSRTLSRVKRTVEKIHLMLSDVFAQSEVGSNSPPQFQTEDLLTDSGSGHVI